MSVTVKKTVHFDIPRAVEKTRKLVSSHILANAQERARSMRCTEHGQPATITLKEGSGENVSISISSCCDAFQREVAKRVFAK